MIPVILKGETSKPIQLTLREGYVYSGCVLAVCFRGVMKTFTDLVAGGTVELLYTAEETSTFPLGTGKVGLSIQNSAGDICFMPWAKIKVTDSPAEVHDAQITIDPATLNVSDATSKDSLGAVKSKLNAVLAFLRGLSSLAVLALPLYALSDVAPLTAQLDDIPGDTPLMTNVVPYVESKIAEASADLTPATNYMDAALGAFASTGAVARATVYGTPTRWTDATGCVWEVSAAPGTGYADWICSGVPDGYEILGVEPSQNREGEWRLDLYDGDIHGFFTFGGPAAACLVFDVYDAMVEARPKSTVTNLVGRVALTNDIPPEQEWPAELVHTNTPLIFADGEDTNVTSIALRAQPENYTSLSFLSPVSYYLPNRFSLLELGHDYQIAAAQWFQVGRYLYAQNPENIVFVGGGQHRSLQDYLDACSPQTMADLLSCYIPTNGGGRIHGDLTIDGRLTAGELITITNSDIHAKGFQVVNKVLTADGLMASNGMVRLNCARFVIGFGTPRIHLETNDLSAITYGGTWEHPAGSVFSWQDSKIQNYLAGDIGQQDIELRNPYMRYMDVKDGFMGWKIKGHNVNNGPLKHFTLDNYRTHHFTDADVGNYGIEFTIASNAHVRIVYDFASAPPSAVYFFCGRDGNDESATMLSNGTELLAPTAGVKTLLEIEHLSGWTFIVKETPLTYQNTVMPWIQAQEEEP